MELKIGNTIKRLRKEKDVTQEDFAELFGVSPQSVSRWENDVCYPDMELLPSIANYFGVSIDELFGCQYDRNKKIDGILAKIDAFSLKYHGDDDWVDDCLAILREGLAEFPGNERLTIRLADTLYEAGWRRHGDWPGYSNEGYLQLTVDEQRKNPYWDESIQICERLAGSAADAAVRTQAILLLVPMYRNVGETGKAVGWANKMPALDSCREILLTQAADGRERSRYIGEFLLKAAQQFSEQLMYGLVANERHFDSDMPILKIKGLIRLFGLVCDDGNYGPCHGNLQYLYLYLSRVQWERGHHDEAFESLDLALYHAKQTEKVRNEQTHLMTAPLVCFVETTTDDDVRKEVVKKLPEEWPFWLDPNYSEVEKEIKADPRWDEWVKKTQE
ncbi:MAG: helix-turn-helix domain-containing protein [Clostridia bacterium]|nr:helix-turn-helix domain-containing protein [Clostridia bacterium]